MANGLTPTNGLSVPQGLTPSAGLTATPGLSFSGFAPGPPGNNGILLEGSLVDFLMQENGADYILQE